jgi:carbon monoxide dehydrogenase subunit G
VIGGEHSVEINASVQELWEFLSAFENWGPFVVGFQNLVQVDEKQSLWTLRGDMGILSRDVEIRVDVTLWEPPRRAEFELTGITERITGTGCFEIAQVSDTKSEDLAQEPARSGQKSTSDHEQARSLWMRLRNALVLRMINRARGRAKHPSAENSHIKGAASDSTPTTSKNMSDARTRLTFKLEAAAGGPMAPMIEMLMAPLLEPAAEDLTRSIQQAMEERLS